MPSEGEQPDRQLNQPLKTAHSARFNRDGPFCVSGRALLYQSGQGDLTMIVEAEWNRRLGRGFNSRRLHHEHTGRLDTAQTD
jgi:hypothetical protein